MNKSLRKTESRNEERRCTIRVGRGPALLGREKGRGCGQSPGDLVVGRGGQRSDIEDEMIVRNIHQRPHFRKCRKRFFDYSFRFRICTCRASCQCLGCAFHVYFPSVNAHACFQQWLSVGSIMTYIHVAVHSQYRALKLRPIHISSSCAHPTRDANTSYPVETHGLPVH